MQAHRPWQGWKRTNLGSQFLPSVWVMEIKLGHQAWWQVLTPNESSHQFLFYFLEDMFYPISFPRILIKIIMEIPACRGPASAWKGVPKENVFESGKGMI